MTEPRRKRLAWILCPATDGEDWKAERADPEEVRQEVRAELERDEPVILLPAGWGCIVVELEHAPPAKDDAAAEQPET